MDYVVTEKEYFDERVQQQINEFVRNNNGIGVWYKIQWAVEKARKFKIYHDKLENYTMPNLFDEDGNAIDWYHAHDPEQRQVNMVKRNLEKSKNHKYSRGRVTNARLKGVMLEVLDRRIDRYLNPEKYMKNNILCIIGQSGVGKTLASLHLQNHKGANVICSYTTRPPRETEVEGREHHFIDIVPDKSELLAYVTFSGKYYYATKEQVFGPCTVYVIDEVGLANLRELNGDNYNIYTLYIKRRGDLRKKSGVDTARMRRDERRIRNDESEYDYVIENNGSKVELFDKIEAIYDEVCNKQNDK